MQEEGRGDVSWCLEVKQSRKIILYNLFAPFRPRDLFRGSIKIGSYTTECGHHSDERRKHENPLPTP